MKRAILTLLTLLFLLTTSCDSTPEPPEAIRNLTPEKRIQANLMDNFVETSDGCYYLNGEFIYFAPSGSSESYPLCSKPNCYHNDASCNAWCDLTFGYHNDALYAVVLDQNRLEFELIRINLDGTDHTVVMTLNLWDCGSFIPRFHNGKLYIYTLANSVLPLSEQEDGLMILDLDSYEQTALFADFFQAGGNFSFIDFFEDKIYGFTFKDRVSQSEPCIIEFDTTSGTYREVISLQIGAVYATETTLYYLEPDVGFREYDLATGEIKDCGLPIEDAWWATYDEDYIYLMGHPRNDEQEHTLYFLNRNYEYLDQVELTDGIFYGYVSSDKLYFSRDYEPLTYYIDKSDIGSHKLSLQPLDGN